MKRRLARAGPSTRVNDRSSHVIKELFADKEQLWQALVYLSVFGLVLAVWLLSILPHLVMTLGAILSASDPLTGLAEEAPEIPRVLGECQRILKPGGRLAISAGMVTAPASLSG